MDPTQKPVEVIDKLDMSHLQSAVRCYFPIGVTTMSTILSEDMLTDSTCPLQNAFHHRALPPPKTGLAIAMDIFGIAFLHRIPVSFPSVDFVQRKTPPWALPIHGSIEPGPIALWTFPFLS